MSDLMTSNIKLPTVRTPELIAAEINSIKEQTRRVVLYNSIEIGRRLAEAKLLIEHGEWGNWLKNSVDYSQRTANNLMRIFEEYAPAQLSLLDNGPNSQAFANLTYTQAVALLGIPSEEREEFAKEHDIENMSTRELEKAIKEKQALEQKLKAKEDELKENENKRLKAETEKNKIKKEMESLQAKNKELITNKEAEIENLKIYIEDIKDKLENAQQSGNEEDVEELKEKLSKSLGDLEETNKKIEELEKQLKEKPIEVMANPEIIEKIPEEIEKELKELRGKVSQASSESTPVIKFSIYFQELVKGFKDILGTLEEIEDETEHEKYKNAVSGLINKMQENLN